MSQAPDSLEEIWPSPEGQPTSMTDPQPITLEGDEESPPQFDRVADVLGPLEQVVLAADQRLGSIQQQVTTQAGEASAEVERRVREAAVEQRRRIAQLREDLTDRASELGARFEAIFKLLDGVDRDLALRAGEGAAEVRVTVTERQRVEFSHEGPAGGGVKPAEPAAQAPPTSISPPTATPTPRKEKGIRRWFRRSKRSSA